MDYRQLGSSGLRVPVLSFGTGAFAALDAASAHGTGEVMVIGGAEIFEQALPLPKGKKKPKGKPKKP